jgi:hypothetical protein
MASVLSMDEKWSGQPKFKGEQGVVGKSELTVVNGQFKPLRDSVNAGESRSDILTSSLQGSFSLLVGMVHDETLCRFWRGPIYRLCLQYVLKENAIPLTAAPWPCWSIAAATSADAAQVKSFLSELQPYVRRFNSAEAREKDDVDFVVNYFDHQREDVEEWLQTVKWEENLAEVKEQVIKDTLE